MTGGKRGGHDIFTLSAPQIRLQTSPFISENG